MKKIISILLVAMLALSSAIAVNAEGIKDVFGNGVKNLEARGAVRASGDYNGNLTWTLYDDGKFVVEGTGSSNGDNASWRDYMYEITSLEFSEGITDVADYAFSSCSNIKSITIPSSVTSISSSAFDSCSGLEELFINCNVTGSSCFNSFYNLKSIVFGEGVTVIGDNNNSVFCGNSSLTSITFPESLQTINYAFLSCQNLASITLPEGLQTIGYVFSSCPKLTSVTIPSSVTSLNTGAFSGCGLQKITLNCNLTVGGCFNSIYNNGYTLKSVVIGEGVTAIGVDDGSAFCGNSNLTSAVIPASVESIKGSFLLGCSSDLVVYGATGSAAEAYCEQYGLTFVADASHTVTFDANGGKFADDSSTKSETKSFGVDISLAGLLPTRSGYEFLGWSTNRSGFSANDVEYTNSYNNESAEAVTLYAVWIDPNIVDSGVYYDNLTWKLTNDGTLTIFGSSYMGSPGPSDAWRKYSADIKTVIIEEGVTSVGYSAFETCTNLTSVSLPSTVTSISDYAFYQCPIEDIVISNNVSSISASSVFRPDILKGITIDRDNFYGFNGYSALESVTFGPNVTTIASGSFQSCSNLTSITIPSNVTTIGSLAFNNSASLTSVTIPATVTSIGDDAFDNCPNLVVYGDLGSTAETYCKANNIPFKNQFGYIASGTLENGAITWYITEEGKLVITGSGDMTNFGGYGPNADAPWYSYRESITSAEVESGITSIGNKAFYGCSKLTSIDIADTVTSIGNASFQNCTSLTSVDIPNNVTKIDNYAFSGCTALTSANIPDSVTSIGAYAFNRCESLTSVDIPDGVTSIGMYTFNECSKLTSVNIPDSVTSIGEYAFYFCSSLTSVDIPSGVTSIGTNAFFKCTDLTSANIPSSIESMGNSVFAYCSSLTSVDIEDGVSVISNYAFRDCTSLASVDIPSSVTTIKDSAFMGCTGLTSIDIPDSVTTIGNSAFYGCTALTSVVIPGGVTSTGVSSFANCIGLTTVDISDGVTTVGLSSFSGCSSLTSVNISDSVTIIDGYAFKDCSSLASIDIPDSVTTIEDYAFANCTVLSSVNIPTDVKSIGVGTFENCYALTSIEIPDNVSSIGNYAFQNCTSLTSVNIPSSVTSLARVAFIGCKNLKSVYFDGDNTSIDLNAIPDETFVIAPKPSKAYDYCNETNTLSRFKEIGSTYDINLNVNGGTLPSGASTTITKTVGTPIASLPTPTKDNDEFIGWSINNTLSGIVDPDLLAFEVNTLYAMWVNDVTFIDLSSNYEGDNNVVEGYEDTKIGKLNGEYSNTWIKQSAKWTDESKTAAEVRVDYSYVLYEPRDVVFVLDVSDSMLGNKYTTMIDTVYKMTYSILTQAKGSRVAFTAFSNDLISSLDFTNDLQLVMSYINSLTTGATTNYSAGLSKARDFVRDRQDKSRDPMLIFFTDGYPNAGKVDKGIYGGAEATSIKALDCPIASVYLGDLSSNGKVQLDAISTTPEMVYNAKDESELIDAFRSAFYSAAHPNEISISIDTARFTTSATTASGGEYGDSIVTIEDNVITWDVSKLEPATPYYITIPLQLVANPESGGPRGASETYPTSLEGNSIARVMDMARGYEVVNEVETPILSASQEEASYIRYYDGSTLLQESIIYDGATTHKLTEAPITSAEAGTKVEDGLPVRSGYLFAGWYTTDLTVGTTNGTAFPETITIADYDDADGNLNLYAAWVPVGTVTKDGTDKNSYGGSSLKGFSLEGVQIRSKEIADKYTNDYNTDQDALRFVTVYRNGMLEELQSLNGKSVSYGYTAYAKTDIANLTKLNKKTTGAVDIDCTKEGDQNHRMFDDYRLSTLVIKYDGADSAYKGDLVEARAYVDYTDANGFGRRGYHTYSDSKFAGGCRTSFDKAWSAVSQAYDALAKVA